jgi:hypothetical protein
MRNSRASVDRPLNAVDRMRRQRLTNLPVTTSDGRLAGPVMLSDAEQALGHIEQ